MSSDLLDVRRHETLAPVDESSKAYALWVDAGLGTNDHTIDAAWRQRRQHLRRQSEHAGREHRDMYRQRLATATERHTATAPNGLLDVLADRGLGWSDIARLVSVSVPALRKWRKQLAQPTGDNHRRLAALNALLDLLGELGVDRPAAWLDVPLTEGYTVTPAHLVQAGRELMLVDYAAGNVTATQMLDSAMPAWRQRYRRDVEAVLDDETGEVFLRRLPDQESRGG